MLIYVLYNKLDFESWPDNFFCVNPYWFRLAILSLQKNAPRFGEIFARRRTPEVRWPLLVLGESDDE